MSNRGVIFDMDGVLVDSYRAHFESWKRTAASRGLGMTEESFSGTFGRTSRAIIRALWGNRFTDEEIARWDAEKEAAYREIVRRDFPAMPGVGELIDRLAAAGFWLAIGSSGPPENVQCVIDCLPQSGNICAVVTGMDVTRSKPDPEVFLKAAEKLGLSPEACAVVEDAMVGIEAARAAGMAAIALTGTASREELSRRAHLVVDSLRELGPEVIGRLLERVQNSNTR